MYSDETVESIMVQFSTGPVQGQYQHVYWIASLSSSVINLCHITVSNLKFYACDKNLDSIAIHSESVKTKQGLKQGQYQHVY